MATLDPVQMMMLKTLYPDYARIQFIPPKTEVVVEASFNPETFLEQMRGGELPTNSEIEELEEGGSVWAGMSEKTRVLFVMVEE